MATKRKSLTPVIADLRGLGPKSHAMLVSAGITTVGQLKKMGAVRAYVKTKRANKSVSINLLYGLVGALDDCHWRDVQRERKLELLNAIEECERTNPEESGLSDLRNIGKAMLKDFEMLGIASVQQLAKCKADKLYAKIQTLTGTRHDPCVWDTYAAAIHQAKTGEALAWWDFTKVRKEREAKGKFLIPSPATRSRSRASIHSRGFAPPVQQKVR
jgi:predicted flap endonuclease-1-like 5' DNA nuclease